MAENETSLRHMVIDAAIQLEYRISLVISSLLDVPLEESTVLGNKSSSLTFKSKTELLTDIRALASKDVKLFLLFAAIRNQFAHNIQANTMTDCCAFLDGTDKALLKAYPPRKELVDKEAQLQAALVLLVMDLSKILDKTLKVIEHKNYVRGKSDANEAIVSSMKIILTNVDGGEELLLAIKEHAEELLKGG